MTSETREITCSIELPVSAERAFQSLLRPSEISKWWQASSAIVLAEPGGFWTATWGPIDDPDYIVAARIADLKPGVRLLMDQFQYKSKDGPLPFEADFETEWRLETNSEGCRLTVKQSGFPTNPESDDYFQGCQTGWENTLAGILALHVGQPE